MTLRECIVLALFSLAIVNANKKILSFGGNGNIGSEVLHTMIESGGHDITLVSRGSWHFDAGVRIMPYVKTVICDRGGEPGSGIDGGTDVGNPLKNCTELMEIVEKTDKFDAILDFSGYEPKWVYDAAELFKDKADVYVYISTDSVYEVCEREDKDRPAKETDSVRPKDEKLSRNLIAGDRYGDAKLAGEEILAEQREKGGIPWVALRLADVIGPRDTTYRWFLYQLWVKFYHTLQIPIYIPPNVVELPESLTYVKDAAKAVLLSIEKGPDVWDNAYNIAMEKPFALWDIVEKIAETMKIEDVEQDNSPNDRSFHLYPSVFNGPIDITKAKEKLGFVPTDPDVAFKETVDWYDDAFINMEAERDEMLQRFVTYVVPREKKDMLYVAVEEELEKHGIVIEKFRKKRKGEIGEFEHEEL